MSATVWVILCYWFLGMANGMFIAKELKMAVSVGFLAGLTLGPLGVFLMVIVAAMRGDLDR